MPSNLYRGNLKAAIKHMLAKAEAASDVEHSGMKGGDREHALRGCIEGYLPSGCTVGEGKIIDINNKQSKQSDTIIYAPQLLAPALVHPDEGYYPIDACLYVVEVKSCLDTDELEDALDKARTLREMIHSEPTDPELAPEYPPVHFLLFAYRTNLKGERDYELTRYLERDEEAFTDPLIPMICVAGRGMWNFRHGGRKEGAWLPGVWHARGATSDHDEIIDFIGVVVNGINDMISKRGRPMIGPYIMESRDFTKHFADGRKQEWPEDFRREIRDLRSRLFGDGTSTSSTSISVHDLSADGPRPPGPTA